MNKQLVSIITSTVRRHICTSSFKIIEDDWSVTVKWGDLGILLSCPRDLDINKYLCEVSLVLKNGELMQYFKKDRLQLTSEHSIINTIYEAYLYYEVLSKIKIQAMKFHFRKMLNKRSSNQTLLHKCFYQIDTSDILYLRSVVI